MTNSNSSKITTTTTTDDRAVVASNRHSEIDEQLLLKEWDFTRFFQGCNERLDKMKQEASSSGKSASDERSSSSSDRTLKRYDAAGRRKDQPQAQPHQPQVQHHHKQNSHKSSQQSQSSQLKAVHRRQESDSKLGNTSAFARAFRRENSDFFPSTRHSAYLQKSEPRSSMFSSGNRRGSEISVAGILGKKSSGSAPGEPVLTEFSYGREPTTPTAGSGLLQRPRREKTESEIVFGSSSSRQQDFLRERHEARLLRAAAAAAAAATAAEDLSSRRRSFRPSDSPTSNSLNATNSTMSSDDGGTIKSTASTTASEYSPVISQVSLVDEP